MKNLILPSRLEKFDNYKLCKNAKNGKIAKITDYAMLNGGFFCCEDDTPNIGKYFINDFCHGKDYAPYIVCYIDEFGHKVSGECTHDVGIRPAMRLSTFYEENLDLKFSRITSDFLEVYYGNYLQDSAEKELQAKLTNAITINSLILKESEKKQIQDILKIDNIIETKDFYEKNETKHHKFTPLKIKVYEYQGRKFAKVKANTYLPDDVSFSLSNGEFYKNNDEVWIEEKPLKWLIDEKQDIMLCENIIQAGVRFDDSITTYRPDFHYTEMNQYLNKYMSKEIFNSKKELVKKK